MGALRQVKVRQSERLARQLQGVRRWGQGPLALSHCGIQLPHCRQNPPNARALSHQVQLAKREPIEVIAAK